MLDPDPPHVHPGEVEEIGGELGQTIDLRPRRREELAPCLLVEILVREELEEAGEREQRRAELVRCVCDELLAGAVELRELDAHAVERSGQLADLIGAVVDHGLVEGTFGDPVGGPLQPPESPRVQRGDGEAEHERDQQGRRRRVQQSPLDELHRGELIGDGAREEHHVPRRQQRHRHLGIDPPVVTSAGPHRPHRPCGLECRWILLDLRAPDCRGIRQRAQDQRFGGAGDGEDDDAGVGDEIGTVDEIVEPKLVLRLAGGIDDREGLRVALLLVELCRDEPPFERGHDNRIRRQESAADDREQSQRQLDADAPGDAHPSRKRYPAPRTVRISSGSRDSCSIFSRRCRTCTSIVRGSR